jgi:HEAT repeat protein
MNRRDVVVAGHRGDPHDIDLVRDAIASPDPSVREAALGALERLGLLDDDALAAALDDPDVGVRRRAAELAAVHPALNLLGALHDPDDRVVEVAAWSCGEHEVVDDATLERLIVLATEASEALVRESSAAALGAIGDPRGLPAILAACSDKPAVRRRAVLALAPFLDGVDHQRVHEAVERALVDRDWQVRQAAEDLCRAARGTMP